MNRWDGIKGGCNYREREWIGNTNKYNYLIQFEEHISSQQKIKQSLKAKTVSKVDPFEQVLQLFNIPNSINSLGFLGTYNSYQLLSSQC
jgi:hypothetical protein